GQGADWGPEDEWDDGWRDPAPRGWRAAVSARLRGTPRAALGLCVVGLVAVLVAAYAVLSSPSSPRQYPVVAFDATGSAGAEPDPTAVSAAESVVGAAGPAGATPAELTVAVVGLVRRPGLHRLAPAARVADALAAAGGATRGADTVALNLAQPLRDGDQVVVGAVDRRLGLALRSAVVAAGSGPVMAAGPGPTAGSGSETPGAGGLVNINTATAAELDTLPGVGAATAAAIVAYRDRHGPFGSVDDLTKVSGIGQAKLARIKPMATV
ncbi:ComEA family DNA-binding protein, partial [Tsukamurella soli]